MPLPDKPSYRLGTPLRSWFRRLWHAIPESPPFGFVAPDFVAAREACELETRQPAAGVVRILLGEGHEPRRSLVVPAGGTVALDLSAETVDRCLAVRVPDDVRSLHHDSTIITPSDQRDWNWLRGFQRFAHGDASSPRRLFHSGSDLTKVWP